MANPLPPQFFDPGSNVATVLKKAGFTGEDLVTAIAISKAESDWNPKAKGGPNSNGTYDWGLMQINDVHKPTAKQKTDPQANADLAFKIYKQAGNSFKPWATYNSGSYKKFVDTARKKAGYAGSGTVESTEGAPQNAITDAVNAFGATVNRISTVWMAVSVAVVLLILGVVILIRKPLGKAATTVAGVAGPGKIGKVASKIKKVT